MKHWHTSLEKCKCMYYDKVCCIILPPRGSYSKTAIDWYTMFLCMVLPLCGQIRKYRLHTILRHSQTSQPVNIEFFLTCICCIIWERFVCLCFCGMLYWLPALPFLYQLEEISPFCILPSSRSCPTIFPSHPHTHTNSKPTVQPGRKD